MAQIGSFTFVAMDPGRLEYPSVLRVALDPQPNKAGVAVVQGALQAGEQVLRSVAYAGSVLDRTPADRLEQAYKDLAASTDGVTVVDSIGRRFTDVVLIRCNVRVAFNVANNQWHVEAWWTVIIPSVRPSL